MTRAVTYVPVEYRFGKGPRLAGLCTELSMAGMFIRSYREPEIDTELSVYFCMIGMVEEKVLHSAVRWVKRGQGFGVEFQGLPLSTIYVLMNCVAAIDKVARPMMNNDSRTGRR